MKTLILILGLITSITATLHANAVEYHGPASYADVIAHDVGTPANWDGIAKLPGCSGALITLTNDPNAKALILTNGHCTNSSMHSGTYISDTPVADVRSAAIYTSKGTTVSARLLKVVYATLTKTDISIYETDTSYAELAAKDAHPFQLAQKSSVAGDALTLISGYWAQEQSCSIAAVIPELREEPNLDTFNAYRYTTCKSTPGWSGTPMIAKNTRTIIGINNTHYSGGTPCSEDNPCEVDSTGRISVGPNGTSYGQQTALIWSCVVNGRFNVNNTGCALKF
ncbi:MAG: trypsin-like peptidase domain-containing protein [Bdellovibrionales bacterium]|nr:trypsin-like peptidase domain-containing protein [Bdellovibrionales bacterium]